MTALDERPAVVCCKRDGGEPCAGNPIVRYFVGPVCSKHLIDGATVYEVLADPAAGDVDVETDVPTSTAGVRARPEPVPLHRLPDPARPAAAVHADANSTAAQAAELVMGRTGKPRSRLIQRFAELGDAGMTSTEAWHWYRETYGPIDLYTLRPRLTELKKDQWLVDSGRVRHPRGDGTQGAPAEEVLVLSQRGRLQLTSQAGAR